MRDKIFESTLKQKINVTRFAEIIDDEGRPTDTKFNVILNLKAQLQGSELQTADIEEPGLIVETKVQMFTTSAGSVIQEGDIIEVISGAPYIGSKFRVRSNIDPTGRNHHRELTLTDYKEY